MKRPNLPKALLIDTQGALDNLAQVLSEESLLGIDTEANSLYAYYERVCLIQISTRDQDYLVDPLALDTLTPLAPVMANPEIEKIFHAAPYDVSSLKRDFDWRFNNLFDTMTAARILGWRKVGLSNILEREFDVKVDKRFQRANWGQRPLPSDRLHYAQMDTHYLPALRDRLARDLKASGYWEEAKEIFEELTHLPASEHSFDPEGFWRIGKSHKIPRQKMAIVRELYLLRDKLARHKDQPPFKIFGNKTIAALAREAPKSKEDLHRIPGMTAGQIRRYGREIFTALERGARQKPPKPPKRDQPPDPAILARYDVLRNWRRDRGVARGVDSDIILSRDALWELAHKNPQTPEALKEIELMGPWKRSTYGEEILNILRRVE